MRQYALLTIFICLLVVGGTIYVANAVAGAMDDMANTVANSH